MIIIFVITMIVTIIMMIVVVVIVLIIIEDFRLGELPQFGSDSRLLNRACTFCLR